MEIITVITIASSGITFLGMIISIVALAVKVARWRSESLYEMTRWQAKSEERAESIMRELKRMNGSVVRTQERMDSHLEGHD